MSKKISDFFCVVGNVSVYRDAFGMRAAAAGEYNRFRQAVADAICEENSVTAEEALSLPNTTELGAKATAALNELEKWWTDSTS